MQIKMISSSIGASTFNSYLEAATKEGWITHGNLAISSKEDGVVFAVLVCKDCPQHSYPAAILQPENNRVVRV